MSSGSAPTVQLTIDGTPVSVPPGTTIFDAARLNGIAIPTLCHQQNENPVGVCRVCVVDVGQRVYAASCIRLVEPGLVVKTSTEPVQAARHTLLELLMSDHPAPCLVNNIPGTANWSGWRVLLAWPSHASRAVRPRAGKTILPQSSPSTTSLASCVTVVSEAVTTSGTTGCWRVGARDTRRVLLSTRICPWGNLPASPVVSAWSPALQARSQTSAW